MTEEKPRHNWNRPIAGPQQPNTYKQVAVYGKSSEQAYAAALLSCQLRLPVLYVTSRQPNTAIRASSPGIAATLVGKQAASVRQEKRVAHTSSSM